MRRTRLRVLLLGGGLLTILSVMAAADVWAMVATESGENSITSPDPADDAGRYTSLALDQAGNPVVSYYDSTNGDLKVLHCNDPDCSGGDETATAPDGAGDVGLYSSLALDQAGNPVVSYYDSTNGDLKVLHCNDPDCSGGDETTTAPDVADDVGMYSSLALDSDDNPVVSYGSFPSFNLIVMHCNDPNCSGDDESITSPDTAGLVGIFTSLALDSGDNPVIGYGSFPSFNLIVMHCNDPNCSGDDESITSPDPTGWVGSFISLALDSEDNPVVSYGILPSFGLQVLRCNDPNCSGDDEDITSLDAAGTVGQYSSVMLDGDGFPVVSYFEVVSGRMKIIHCDSANCRGGSKDTPASTPTTPAHQTPTPTATFTPTATVIRIATPATTFTPTATPATPATTLTPTSAPPTPTWTPHPTASTTASPALVLTATPTRTPRPAATPAEVMGDVDCTGTVNSVDAALILQFDVGLTEFLPCLERADVNRDGLTNAVDAALALQFVAGLIPDLSGG